MSLSKQQTMGAVAAAVALISGIYYYSQSGANEETPRGTPGDLKVKKKKSTLEQAYEDFVDPANGEIRSIYKKDAITRSQQINDVSY